MSALGGQKQTFRDVRLMSAILPKADIDERGRDVRFVPIGDMCIATKNNTAERVDTAVLHLNTQSSRRAR